MPNPVLRRIAVLSLLFMFHAQAVRAADDALAANSRGQILKFNGDVYVLDQQGVERKVEATQSAIYAMDTVVTREGSGAVVQLDDGALSVLDEKSSLRVEQTSWLSHLGGKIYFTFRKVFGEPKRVKTPFSTIGVRGTTFIVYANDTGEGLALREGQLDIESPSGAYELHIKRELDDFAAFKQQALEKEAAMRNEFDSYKKQIDREFVEYRKRFTLESDRVIRFKGHRVDASSLASVENAGLSAEFANFEQEAGELLQQFRAQAKEPREQQEDEH